MSAVRLQPHVVGADSSESVDGGEADFGTWPVDEIHLCRMGSFDEQGKYVSVGHVALQS